MIWDGKVLDPAEAFQIGIIDEVTDQLEGSIQLKLQSWLNKPLLAMIKTKNIYAELNREKLLNTLEHEKQAQWAMRQTKDHREGIQAFIEKRKPIFQGK